MQNNSVAFSFSLIVAKRVIPLRDEKVDERVIPLKDEKVDDFTAKINLAGVP